MAQGRLERGPKPPIKSPTDRAIRIRKEGPGWGVVSGIWTGGMVGGYARASADFFGLLYMVFNIKYL